MKKKKQYWIVALVVALIAAIGAGYYVYMNRFNASEYVKAVLDVSYKNKTEEYIALTDTPKEEAEQIFEKNLDVTMEEFDSLNLPDELSAKYRELFGNIAGKVSYTVGQAQKDKEGNYTVEVMVKPITLFEDTYATFQQKAKEYAEQVSNDVMAGAEMPSDEQMQNDVYQIYYDVLMEEWNQGLQYGEAVNVTLHVVKAEDGEYKIKDEDMKALDAALISEAKSEAEESAESDSAEEKGTGTDSAEEEVSGADSEGEEASETDSVETKDSGTEEASGSE